MDLHEVTDFLKNEYTGEKPGTYDLKVWDFDSKNQGLMTRKSGTYDSKTRDLRHESAIVTTRNTILLERNIVFLYDYYTEIIHF